MKKNIAAGTKSITRKSSKTRRVLPLKPATLAAAPVIGQRIGQSKKQPNGESRLPGSTYATRKNDLWQPVGPIERRNRLIQAAVRLWELRRNLSSLELIIGSLSWIQWGLRLFVFRLTGFSSYLWGIP